MSARGSAPTGLPASPAPIDVLRGLKLSDGVRWGEVATPHQVEDVTAILDDDPDAPRLHYSTRPRGGSKSTDLALVLLALLITGRLGHGDIAYCFAVDRDQARLLLDAMRRVAHATGLGADLVTFGPYVAESPRHGGRVEVRPVDAGGSFGLLPSFLVIDEIGQWPETPTHQETFLAVLSSQPKTGCPLVVATSAGAPSHFSWKLLEQAKGSPRWRVSEMGGPVAWLDPDGLAEQRRLLRPSEYARLHLNEWVEGEDSLATAEDVDAAAVLDGPLDYNPAHRYAIGLDLGVTRDRTALIVARLAWPDRWVHEPAWDRSRVPDRSQAPTVVVDRRMLWVPSRMRSVDLTEVELAVRQAAREFRARVVLDPWQALGLSQRLRAGGVEVTEHAFTQASVSRLASTLFTLLRDRRLWIPVDDGDPNSLAAELRSVRLVERGPGLVRIDHDRGRHDDQVLALALACHALVEGAGGGGYVGSAVWSSGRDRGRGGRRAWLESARRVGSDGLLRELERAGVVEPVGGVPVSVGVLAGGRSRRGWRR